jgi:hypothetical protein
MLLGKFGRNPVQLTLIFYRQICKNGPLHVTIDFSRNTPMLAKVSANRPDCRKHNIFFIVEPFQQRSLFAKHQTEINFGNDFLAAP